MPTSSIIVSALIVAAFATFAIALAYGEYVTRNIKKADAATAEQEREQPWLKAA